MEFDFRHFKDYSTWELTQEFVGKIFHAKSGSAQKNVKFTDKIILINAKIFIYFLMMCKGHNYDRRGLEIAKCIKAGMLKILMKNAENCNLYSKL